MPVPLYVMSDKTRRMGLFYTWWLDPPPQQGEQLGRYEIEKGFLSSSGHKRDHDGKYRRGGPFFTLRFRTDVMSSGPTTTYRGAEQKAYVGVYHSNIAWLTDYSYMPMWNSEQEGIANKAYSYGAQAMEALRPDKPDFSPFVGVVELGRELPGILSRIISMRRAYFEHIKWIENEKRTGGLKGKPKRIDQAGKAYLALQFGWLPLLNDIRSFFKAYRNSRKRATQLLRDNGKWVRRRVNLSPKPSDSFTKGWETNLTTPYHPDMKPTHVTQCYVSNPANGGGLATSRNEYRTQTQVWAVGKSKYYLPPELVSEPMSLARLERRLYRNFTPSIEDIYNLIPWTWLIDYFFNFGNFFGAVSKGISERIIWDYAYVMRSQVHLDRTRFTQYTFRNKTQGQSVTCTIDRTGTLKSRVNASVFGFGPTMSDLSPTQAAILGALGLSRL